MVGISMRTLEIDFNSREITLWVKDDQLHKCWVRTYNIYRGGRYEVPEEILELALELAQEYGVRVIRVIERVGGYAYEWMRSHTARRKDLVVERYLMYDMQYGRIVEKGGSQ
jgi:hypothetical protein